MSTVAKSPLSASVDGAPIKIAATASPGTTVHVSGATSVQTAYLTITNTSTAAVAVTIQKAGTTSPDTKVLYQYSLPADGFPHELPPMVITNSKNILVFAGTTNVVLVDGFINSWEA